MHLIVKYSRLNFYINVYDIHDAAPSYLRASYINDFMKRHPLTRDVVIGEAVIGR